jgi:hypothetical protein
MDATKIAAIVGLLVALSAASERVVEIVKGLVPWLSDEGKTAYRERLRKMVLQILAVAAGIVTTLLARSAIPADLLPDSAGFAGLLALGLLASGGSGFWNSVLTYVLQVKNIKEGLAAVAEAKVELAAQVKKQIGTAGGGHGMTNLDQAAGALAKLDS